jgi:outer membrane protein TolC
MPEFEAVAQGSPFLQELIARKEAARLGIKSAGADFFPQIYANASAGKTDSQWPPSQNQWSMGISVSFPLFEGGSRLAQYDKARAVFNQSQADERSGKDGVLLTLEQTWINLQNSIDNLGVQKKFLAAAKERSKIAQAEYSIGLITFDTWTIIEDAFVSAKKAFLNTQYNALIAEANWAQAKGVTLDENQ